VKCVSIPNKPAKQSVAPFQIDQPARLLYYPLGHILNASLDPLICSCHLLIKNSTSNLYIWRQTICIIFQSSNKIICLCHGCPIQSAHLSGILNFFHQWNHRSFKVALDILNHWGQVLTTTMAFSSCIGHDGKTLADGISRNVIDSSRVYFGIVCPQLPES
jgi:hypothetical protein